MRDKVIVQKVLQSQPMPSCLLNFAASPVGGGYKRLYEYAAEFNASGGASFVIHPAAKNLVAEFPRNRFFVVDQPRYQRLFNDCGYLADIIKETGRPDLYYSYGIPIYNRVGRLNWFHLTNALTLRTHGIPLSGSFRLKVMYLGWHVRRNLHNADVISAESRSSLELFDDVHAAKFFVSVNGSDDELASMKEPSCREPDNVATAVGTYTYKALDDSCRIFDMLRDGDNQLRLVIIGHEGDVPRSVRDHPGVVLAGELPRRDVIDRLKTSRYYISTTYVENSYNAASEGAFLAVESFISDIGPHRELLHDVPFDRIGIRGMNRPMLHVRRSDMSAANVKTWKDVVLEMMDRVYAVLPAADGKG